MFCMSPSQLICLFLGIYLIQPSVAHLEVSTLSDNVYAENQIDALELTPVQQHHDDKGIRLLHSSHEKRNRIDISSGSKMGSSSAVRYQHPSYKNERAHTYQEVGHHHLSYKNERSHTYEECPYGEERITVTVLTDQYHYENSWNVTDLDGNLIYESQPMTSMFELYVTNFCVPESICYCFTIYDSYGDGIGSGGYYLVEYDETVVSPGGPFSWKQHVFVGGTVCDMYTLPPTPAPTAVTPGPTTTLTPCPDGQARVSVSVHTDLYPHENSWTIKNKFGNIKLANDPFIEANTIYRKSECLWEVQCYIFTIYDSFSDGILHDNDYSVIWNGIELNPNKTWTYVQNLYIGGSACDSFTQWPTASPTTTMWPTAIPVVTSPPTPSLEECPEGTSRLQIILFTDKWPDETSWKLENMAGDLIAEGGNFAISEHKYTSSYCIDSTECYEFTMMDSYGDGLDNNEGYFLVWEEERLLPGNQEWEEEQKTYFGGNGCAFCGRGEQLFTLELQTDNYGGESYWDLKKRNNKGKFKDYIWNGYDIAAYYKDNRLYVEKYCVPQRFCYKFVFADAFGDGLCCSQGEGYWKISWGNKVIRRSDFIVPVDMFPKYNDYSRKFGRCNE